MRRLAAVDTTTVYPLLLMACNKLLPDQETEFTNFLIVLESFLVETNGVWADNQELQSSLYRCDTILRQER